MRPPELHIPTRGETPRDRWVAAGFSSIFHGLLLAFLLWIGVPHMSELLEGDLGGGGGGSGGDDINLISLAGPPEQVAVEPVPVPPPPPEPDVVPDPTPTPVPTPPVDTTKAPPSSAAPVPLGTPPGSATGGGGAGSAGSGGGAGGGSGTGVGTGTGSGTGAGSGGGTGGGGTSPDGVIPPSPSALVIPPTAPKKLNGMSVVVNLTVDVNGRVLEAHLEQSTGDSKYDAALRKSALSWRFRPARNRAGEPVKATFAFTTVI